MTPAEALAAQARARALPEPGAGDSERSAELAARIHAAIDRAGGVIGFDAFMELALYAPGLGYYSAGIAGFDQHGDFVTAPELSGLFGRCLARQCAEILAACGGDTIVEVGAGSGALCVQLLAGLEALGQLPARYLVVEVSPALRARQRATVERAAPHLAARVSFQEALPAQPVRGVVVMNELLDALPVRCFALTGTGITESGVGRGESGFNWRPLEGSDIAARLAGRFDPRELGPGYRSEFGAAAEAFVARAAAALAAGAVLIADYGFPRREFYHPQRRAGTLMCHYRHRAHDDPFFGVGLQDITAHVDFTATAEAGVAAGLDLLGFAPQASFLLGAGLLEEAERAAAAGERERYAVSQQVQKLAQPHEMGELFKVMMLGRGIEGDWCGFRLGDHSGRL